MSEQTSAILIQDAVQGGDHSLSPSDKRFAESFDRLVYTQIWEDPEVDIAAMELKPGHKVATICSAGCNALSYLTAAPDVEVTAIDLNFSHLSLAGLKRAAFGAVGSYDDIRSLFVKAAGARNRALYQDRIAAKLPAGIKAYWEGGRRARYEDFVSGFFKKGLLGKAITLARLLARLHGVRLEDALAMDDADQQRAWARKVLRPVFEGRLLSMLFSLRHPLFLLGIPPRQFELLCDGRPDRMASVLADRTEQLLGAVKSSENYFLWQAFTHGYKPSADGRALPPYLTRENFDIMRRRACQLHLEHDSVTNFLARQEAAAFDRYVLLDAQDWMDERTLVALWSQIGRTAKPGARVVFRTAGTIPPFTPYLETGAWSGWRRLDALSDQLHARDRSGIYGNFHVYELAA
ncbi:MAG: BtaA family protein [Proteobacteria bacterium]|nr:BtaA family protein [Pseudomonadota bacterium]